IDELRRGLDLGRARPGLDHLLEHGALLGREALHRLDQVRNEVGAALVDVLHLRPLLVDALLGLDELVVDPDPPDEEADEGDDYDSDDGNGDAHELDYTPWS